MKQFIWITLGNSVKSTEPIQITLHRSRERSENVKHKQKPFKGKVKSKSEAQQNWRTNEENKTNKEMNGKIKNLSQMIYFLIKETPYLSTKRLKSI